MDDDRRGGPLTGGLLELVGPAAVVGHGAAPEQLLVAGREARVIDEDDRGLAAHVDAGVIVPARLGRDHPVPHEHQGALGQRDLRRHALGPDDHVLAVGERRFAETQLRVGSGGDLDDWDLLCPRTAVTGLQAEFLELADEVIDGLALPGGAGLAALELVTGKRDDVALVLGGRDRDRWRRSRCSDTACQ